MAPSKSSEVTTAGGRPATRAFSAGEWPTGTQTPTVTVSGGNIDAVLVFFFLDEVADACLPPYGASPRTDLFNRQSLNPMWTLDQGAGNIALSFPQTGGIIRCNIDWNNAAADWSGSTRGPSVYQDVSDVDFDIEVQKDPLPTNGGAQNVAGLIFESSNSAGLDYLNFIHYTFGSSHSVTCSEADDGSQSYVFDAGTASGETAYVRATKSGNSYEFLEPFRVSFTHIRHA